jgi:hypothetical protein
MPPPPVITVLQTPAEEDRAAPYKPKAALLYTGGNSTAAAELSEGLLPGPALTAASLIAAQRYLEAFQADLGSGAAAVPGGWGVWGAGRGVAAGRAPGGGTLAGQHHLQGVTAARTGGSLQLLFKLGGVSVSRKLLTLFRC